MLALVLKYDDLKKLVEEMTDEYLKGLPFYWGIKLWLARN